MINIKENKGITLISLAITIAIILILTAVVAYNFSASNEKAYYNKMVSDIELLNDKILVYYNKYGEIPKTTREITVDGTDYYEIDLSKLENVTLNYGTEHGGTTALAGTSDAYVVDEDLNVYYLKGIELNDILYHTDLYGEEIVESEIPEQQETPTITLSTTQISKTISSGSTATVSLTATLNNASGNLTWTSSNTSVAGISGSGTTRTITLKSEGTAIITVSYGSASATCRITVTEEASNLISFTINGKRYYAEDGMIWNEWAGSSFDTIGLHYQGAFYDSDGNRLNFENGAMVEWHATVKSGYAYYLGS